MTVAGDLVGKRALVTGAGGGIGAAIARRLGQAGAVVVLSDLPGPALEQASDAAARTGAHVVQLAADLSDDTEASALPVRARDDVGGLDLLVNCAGVMQTKPFADLTVHDWRRVVDTNLTAVFLVTQSAAKLMAAQGAGSVVTVASVAARSGRPNSAHYAATKTALLSLTKSAAMAFAPDVRFNAVCPGVFLTPMWDAIMQERDERFGAGSGDDYLNEVLREVPLSRAGSVEELASVVTFLLSDHASYITGQAINVDGGLEMN